jgi:hypothetical protein
MKLKPFHLSILITLLCITLAAVTNPSLEDFQEKIKAAFRERYSDDLNNPAFEEIAREADKFTQKAADRLTERRNLLLCSIHTFHMPDGDVLYLGVFGHFFALQSYDPLSPVP